ncbi:MAG TPA: helix-turn-helix domain-containing protein [Chiayiivirga sp.]|nr:helix-turn-helix domain-containing protein [Chiayiivirga sp.]
MNTDERRQFSQRLAEAMQTTGYEPRPSVLEKLFNSRYSGRSVTFTSVSRWLNGHSIPEQDKLQVLARLFGMEPHALRYGEPSAKRSKRAIEGGSTWPTPLDPADRAAIDSYLALPEPLRQHLRAVIAALRG